MAREKEVLATFVSLPADTAHSVRSKTKQQRCTSATTDRGQFEYLTTAGSFTNHRHPAPVYHSRDNANYASANYPPGFIAH